MSNIKQISENEAIRKVIAEGKAMDYIDVVEAVRKEYGLSVSSALVEKVHSQLRRQAKALTKPRISLEAGTLEHEEKYAELQKTENPETDHLALALRFVQSVKGLANAKKALAELESMMQELAT